MTPSRGVRLLGTDPRAQARVSFLSPTPSQRTDGDRPSDLTLSQRRVSSVSSSVTPRVEGGFFVGLGYGLVFSLPFWTVVVYGTVRGVW